MALNLECSAQGFLSAHAEGFLPENAFARNGAPVARRPVTIFEN
jgi:hypothetical protein